MYDQCLFLLLIFESTIMQQFASILGMFLYGIVVVVYGHVKDR